MSQWEWTTCPECGKKLCRADLHENAQPITLYLWCKKCKKEVEVKVGAHTVAVVVSFESLPAEKQKELLAAPSSVFDFRDIDFRSLRFCEEEEPRRPGYIKIPGKREEIKCPNWISSTESCLLCRTCNERCDHYK